MLNSKCTKSTDGTKCGARTAACACQSSSFCVNAASPKNAPYDVQHEDLRAPPSEMPQLEGCRKWTMATPTKTGSPVTLLNGIPVDGNSPCWDRLHQSQPGDRWYATILIASWMKHDVVSLDMLGLLIDLFSISQGHPKWVWESLWSLAQPPLPLRPFLAVAWKRNVTSVSQVSNGSLNG